MLRNKRKVHNWGNKSADWSNFAAWYFDFAEYNCLEIFELILTSDRGFTLQKDTPRIFSETIGTSERLNVDIQFADLISTLIFSDIQILHSEYFEYLAFYCPGQPNIHHHPTSHVVLLFLFHHPYSCFCPKLTTPHPRSRFAACGKIKILANLSECTFARWSWQESHLKIHAGRKTKATKQKLPHKPPPAASTHNNQFRKKWNRMIHNSSYKSYPAATVSNT